MKFRIFLNNSLDGPFAVAELWQVPGFSLVTSVCPDGEDAWQPASQYPVITEFYRQVMAGDYDPTQTITDEPQKITSTNWRQAVIGNDVPEVRFGAIAIEKPSQNKRRQKAESPSMERMLGDHRKGILVLLLGFVSLGVYYPQTENITTFLAGLSTNEEAMMAMGSRFRSGGSPHAGSSWKHKTLGGASTAVKVGVPDSPAAPEVVEIGSEDLGNGLLLKTVVITKVRDGVRTQQTKNITVPNHPRKTRKAKTLKSGSSRIRPGVASPIS